MAKTDKHDRINLTIGDPALYLLVNKETSPSGTREGWLSDPLGYRDLTLVHVMSPTAGGECRGYWLDDERRLWLRSPCYTGSWPDLDAAVAEALDAEVVPYTAHTGGGSVCFEVPAAA